MTPEDLYRYDINGYLLLEGAIASDELSRLNARIDVWEKRARKDFAAKSAGENQEVRYDDVVNQEESLVGLAANPVVLPYIREMVELPRLKSTWIAFKWRGGQTTLHSNHTPSVTHNLLYERVFEAAPESSWLKYLTRQPNGFRETYLQPTGADGRSCGGSHLTGALERPTREVPSRAA